MNEVILEDCLTGLAGVSDGSIHLTFTSPPYFNARDYSDTEDTSGRKNSRYWNGTTKARWTLSPTWETYEGYLSFLEDVFTEVYRTTADKRMCVVNISPTLQRRKSRMHESRRLPIPYHLFNIMEKIGWVYLDNIVWVKPEGSSVNRNGQFYKHRKPVAYKPNVVTESLLVFQKPAPFLIDKIVRSYKGEVLKNSLVKDGYERSNVWSINPETKSKHSAPFPKKLSDRVVEYYSFVGDNVLDPFMGSGTTATSCVDLGRNYLGFEVHEEYVAIARERINEQENKKS